MAPSKILHVLWSPGSGPLCAYWDPTKAWNHARTMLGIEVSSVEVRTDLPEVVKADIEADFDGDSDDDTPRIDSPRVKTVQMPPIVDPRKSPMEQLKAQTPAFGAPVVPEQDHEPAPAVARTRARAAMAPLPHPTSMVEVALEDLEEDPASKKSDED